MFGWKYSSSHFATIQCCMLTNPKLQEPRIHFVFQEYMAKQHWMSICEPS